MNTSIKGEILQAPTNAGAALIAGAADAEERLKFLREHHDVEGGRPFRLTADGTPSSLEGWMPSPSSMRGTVELHDVVSFAAYVNRFKAESTLVFADERESRFTAVLDYHEGQGTPHWLKNRAFLQLVHTDRWSEWLDQDGAEHAMPQDAFAQFLEDHIPDIAEPAGAKLVEMARNLEATISGKFQSAIRASDGSINFQYLKDVQATTTTTEGKVALPTEVTLLLQPYESIADKYKVTGKLRYRITGGRLSLWFDLFGADEALEEAFRNIRANVEATLQPTLVVSGPSPAVQAAE